ncbi:hypothetical protein [Simplicispira psychrophila]|uniref:hypothetical protein n=1 Tax=Simplicispira psychrophila TaxID=80882 RepID=UPI0009FE78C2|nr:hypothetical protein [Simplicispira psychrophila]
MLPPSDPPSPAALHHSAFFIPPPPDVPAQFVYVRIPLQPRQRVDPLHQREDEIDQALHAQGIGTVLGWGDSLGERRADGSRVAAYLRIDINVSDLAAARTTLQQLLPTLEAPAGTEIHYTLQGVRLQDRATATGWLLEQPVP